MRTAVLILFLLAGCTRSTELADKVELKFLCPTEKSWQQYFRTAIDLFHKKQSRIRVRMIGTGGAGLNQKFLDMIPYARFPNFSRICPDNLGDYGKFLLRMESIWLGMKSAAEVLGEETPKLNAAIAESQRHR